MLHTRELPRDEWPRLKEAQTELASIAARLPAQSRILVVEDDGVIVGAWGLFSILHAEGIWIAPSHRKRAGVARRLLATMRAWVQDMGAGGVITGARNTEVSGYLMRLGAEPLPTAYFWRLTEDACR